MTDDLVGRLRAALIEAGREAGAFLADDVSDDFLLYVPGEVKGRIAKLTARIEALEGENRVLRGGLERIAQRDPGNIVRNDEDCERHTLWNIARYTLVDTDRLRVAQHLKQENAKS